VGIGAAGAEYTLAGTVVARVAVPELLVTSAIVPPAAPASANVAMHVQMTRGCGRLLHDARNQPTGPPDQALTPVTRATAGTGSTGVFWRLAPDISRTVGFSFSVILSAQCPRDGVTINV